MYKSKLFVLTAQVIIGLGIAQANSLSYQPKKSCTQLTLPEIHGLEILSIENVETRNYSLTLVSPPVIGLSFCNSIITLTHPGANDEVHVEIWMPLDTWNGRFQATGGGGLVAGYFDLALAPAVSQGFAAASTDAGLTVNGSIDPTGQWALKSDGGLNTALVENFAYRSIHDMTVIGKALVEAYYDTPARYSYYSGCSTGGRQGYFAAQIYPGDFDGILADSPAINTPQVSPADFWPSVVMGNNVAPPQCVFNAYQNATIAFCDPLDGVVDDLISDPDTCHFDTKRLVGLTVGCEDVEEGKITITSAHANVVSQILQGATSTTGQKLWYGNPPGAPFSGLADTVSINGSIAPVPFAAAEDWIIYFVQHDPEYNAAKMTYKDFDQAFWSSVSQFTGVLGTDHPDLSEFRNQGGKLLTFHGMADPLIAHLGTTQYRDKLDARMGGPDAVDHFYRLFLAPGVGHCGGGYGAVPNDPFGALQQWVESGLAPDTLAASGTDLSGREITRNLCRYPKLLKYKGGSPQSASSFICA